MRSVAIGLVAALAFAGSAGAEPLPETVIAEDGGGITQVFTSCVPHEFFARTRAPSTADATSIPAVGTVIDGYLEVTKFAIAGGVATWTVVPNAAACVQIMDLNGYDVELDNYPFRVRFQIDRLTVRTTQTRGIRSIAGFPVTKADRPTIAKATKYFGKPTLKQGGGGIGCSLRWANGLKLVFEARDGQNGCQHGVAQEARIYQPTKWAVVVAGRPAIVETSGAEYLEARSRATFSNAYDEWSFARHPEHLPAVGAIGGQGGDLWARYELWIGAATP